MVPLHPVSKNQPHFQQGQSLLEMVVLIGLALVIVTGLTIVTTNGLKNSQFSQNQAQATRLAQDAVDCIRSIKDQNKPVTASSGTTYYWYDAPTPTTVWTAPELSGPVPFKILTGCSGLQNSATDDSIPAALKGTFSRTITLQSFGGSSQKKVTVVVNWTDFSGTHQSNLATIIGQN